MTNATIAGTDAGEDVVLTLKQLAVIKSPDGKGIETAVALWDGITATEYFPSTGGSAFYVLRLKKPARTGDEAERVDLELQRTLFDLRRVWQFASGGRMATTEAEVQHTALHESNATAVRDRLLAAKGMHHVSASFKVCIESAAGYRRMPLRNAFMLCGLARADKPVSRLFDYYDKVWTDPASWFVHLYKVREQLEKLAGNAACAKSKFGISHDK